MTRGLNYFIWFILFGLFTTCSSDDGGGTGGIPTGELILEAIVGDWIATEATFTTINANPLQSRDVVADGGTCDLSVSLNYHFVLVVRNPGSADPQLTTGFFEPAGDFIDVRLDANPNDLVRWDFTLSGGNLFIDGPVEYDFENDKTFEQTSSALHFMPN